MVQLDSLAGSVISHGGAGGTGKAEGLGSAGDLVPTASL